MTVSRPAIEADYAALAATYDARWQTFNTVIHDWIMARLPELEARDRVIDLGCGTGRLLSRIAGHHHEAVLTGIDASKDMLEQAHRSVPSARFLSADIETVEPDRQYDLVCSVNVSHHLNDPAAHLIRLRRFCRTGGTVFLCDFALETWPMKLADAWWRFSKPSYNQAFTKRDLQRAITGGNRRWTIAESDVLAPDRLWRLQIYKIRG